MINPMVGFTTAQLELTKGLKRKSHDLKAVDKVVHDLPHKLKRELGESPALAMG